MSKKSKAIRPCGPATQAQLASLNCLKGKLPGDNVTATAPLAPLLERVCAAAGTRRFAVFGYGSLMWDPGFAPQFRTLARIYGYARRPCIKSTFYRGTPAAPGLVFGLDAGGSCNGLALGIPVRGRQAILCELFSRECFQGTYWPQIITGHLPNGATVDCLAFITNRTSHSYAPPMADRQVRHIVHSAHGERGTCLTYWRETEREFRTLGIQWSLGRLVTDG